MQRWVFLVLILVVSCTYHKANISDLPEEAQDFVNTYFSSYTIHDIYFENRHDDLIEVEFKDDTYIIFEPDGEWEEIVVGTTPLKADFLPPKALETIQEEYPKDLIKRVERDGKDFNVKLKSGYELSFDKDGSLDKVK